MKKKPILVICSVIVAAVLGGGVVFYFNEKRLEEQAVVERRNELWGDMSYANTFEFTCYTTSLGYFGAKSLVSEVINDPMQFTRIDFYDERPADFEFEKIKDGVVVAFPSETTPRCLEEFNINVKYYKIDAQSFGFDSEVTMHDLVNRREEVDALFDALPHGF